MSTPVIDIQKNEKWDNWHRTIHVGGKVSQLLTPKNEYTDGSKPPNGKEFLPGLEGLKKIIQMAQADNMKVRAHGSRWSLNNVAYTDQFLVDSRQLGVFKIGIDQADFVTEKYQDKKNQLCFVQCGVMVRALNNGLEASKLALPTSGASDGQTLIGAIATGTHGAANQVGAMTEFVRGIHLVIPGKHIFIQRKSDQAVTSAYCSWLGGAELVLDDALFNAALVGFGSFGLIHGLLIETEPIYFLERIIKNYDFSEVQHAITTLDMKGLDLPQGDQLPFHFEVALNPYNFEDGEKGAFVRVYYKHGIHEELAALQKHERDATPDIHSGVGHTMDEEKGTIMDGHSHSDEPHSSRFKFIRGAVQLALKLSFPVSKPGDRDIRYPNKFFTGDNSADPTSASPLPATSIEIGIPFDRIGDAVHLIHDTVQKNPFAAPLALRYVKKSSATIGFTGLAPITVTLEMPGPFGHILFPRTGSAHQALFDALAASDIPHSYHWGQQLPANIEWAKKAYGDRLSEWKAQRLKLLGAEGVKMFTNEFIESFLVKKQKSWFTMLFEMIMRWFGRRPAA